jgi:hypothetical protein
LSPAILMLGLVAGVATSSAAAPADDEDTIIVIDEGDAPAAPGSEDDVIVVDDAAAPAAPAFSVRARASATLDLRLAVDTSFDRRGEQVGELWLQGGLVLEVTLAPGLSVYAAPRLSWVGALSREGDDRWLLLTRAPEAYLSWAHGPVQVRAGYLVFDWGTSEVVGPVDVLNPLDLRQALTSLDADLKIPVPAVEAVVSAGWLTVRGVVEPVFTPGRFFVTGWDGSIMQGGLLPGAEALADPSLVNPAYIDRVGDQLVQTDRPSDRPDHATLGLRATASLDALDVSASVVHGWNPLPSVSVDPNLITVADAVARARLAGQAPDFGDPALAGALTAVQTAVEDDAPLFKGTYQRRTVAGVDAAWALDPLVLKVDVAYSTAQLLYNRAGQARTSPALTAVAGVEYYRGEVLQIWVEGFWIHLLEVNGSGALAFLEPADGAAEKGRGVDLFGAGAFARGQLLEGDLVLEAGAVVSSRGDLALMPRASYAVGQGMLVTLGGLLVEGRGDGAGGAYTHLDQLYLAYRLAY